jgi:hypothetical protein
VEGIDFHLKRYLKTDIFIKNWLWRQRAKISFHWKVKALTLQDFEGLMEEAGIYLLDIFGDYKLKKFYKNESEP